MCSCVIGHLCTELAANPHVVLPVVWPPQQGDETATPASDLPPILVTCVLSQQEQQMTRLHAFLGIGCTQSCFCSTEAGRLEIHPCLKKRGLIDVPSQEAEAFTCWLQMF